MLLDPPKSGFDLRLEIEAQPGPLAFVVGHGSL
jgi:hypothetical protein